MRILKFSAQNIKGIRVVEISPKGDVVTISGKNEVGKSTILNCIERTLCGGQLRLRNTEKKGTVEINLGDYVISRVVTDKTDRLIVKSKEGATYPSPRDFLSKFIGPLSIDPLAFVRLKDKEQLDILFGMNPDLKDGLAEKDKAIADIKEERSIILKEGTRLKVELENIQTHEDAPEEPVSVVALTEQLNEAIRNNTQIEEQKEELEDLKKDLDEHKVIIENTQAEIANLQAALKETQAAFAKTGKAVDEATARLKDAKPVDISAISKQIADSEMINEKVRENQEHARIATLKEEKTKEYAAKLEEMRKIETEKSALLSNANMPIDDLSVSESSVIYKGVPMSELCTSEKVKVGASIAVAQNPKAKIILADDVSLLDSENLKILHKICSGFQLWQVVNDESGDVGFYIEEGALK